MPSILFNTSARIQCKAMLHLEGALTAAKIDRRGGVKHFVQPRLQQKRPVCLLIRPVQLLKPDKPALKLISSKSFITL